MYARDDAAMERYELARTIHQERIRALEIALHHRRLLQPADVPEGVARTTSAPETSKTRPTSTQPAGSAARRSTPLAR
jgi:hypothetical protein